MTISVMTRFWWVDAKGDTTYPVIRREVAQVDAHQWLGNGLDILLAQARKAVEEEENRGRPAVGRRPSCQSSRSRDPQITSLFKH